MAKRKNGRGSNGGPRRRPWEPEQLLEERPKEIEEYHLDCQGRKRLFRIHEVLTPVGGCLEAQEIRDGEPTGWRLPVAFDPVTGVPPYYELRRRLATRLATRDLVRDPETDRLEVLNLLIRAQIGEGPELGEAPDLVIDGEVVSWETLGKVLAPYAGWGLRIQITDTGEE